MAYLRQQQASLHEPLYAFRMYTSLVHSGELLFVKGWTRVAGRHKSPGLSVQRSSQIDLSSLPVTHAKKKKKAEENDSMSARIYQLIGSQRITKEEPKWILSFYS